MRARPRLAAFRVSSEVSYVSSTEVGFRLSIIRSLICQLNKSWLHSSAEVSVPAQQKLDAFRVSSEVAHVSSKRSWMHSEYHQTSHMSAQQQLAAFKVSSEVSCVSSTEVGRI